MAIETLDDIIESVADQAGIYGAHDDSCKPGHVCRVCWTSDLRDHLMAAFEVERKLYGGQHVNNAATASENQT